MQVCLTTREATGLVPVRSSPIADNATWILSGSRPTAKSPVGVASRIFFDQEQNDSGNTMLPSEAKALSTVEEANLSPVLSRGKGAFFV